jgi:predicted Zn-dependent protease
MASRIAAPMSALSLALGVALAASTVDPQLAFQGALEAKGRGELEPAEAQLREVCQVSPGWALPWIELAEIQLARGAPDQALASVMQAAVLDAANPRVYHDRALVESAMGRADLAERDEAFAVSLRPEFTEALAHLAELRWAAGKRQEALNLLQSLAAAHPDQVTYTVRLIEAYSELGQNVAAERELRLLIAQDPQNPIWHRRLARLLAAQGLNDEAQHETELAEGLSHKAKESRRLRQLPKSKH